MGAQDLVSVNKVGRMRVWIVDGELDEAKTLPSTAMPSKAPVTILESGRHNPYFRPAPRDLGVDFSGRPLTDPGLL
jgi:hypothetical protein